MFLIDVAAGECAKQTSTPGSPVVVQLEPLGCCAYTHDLQWREGSTVLRSKEEGKKKKEEGKKCARACGTHSFV